MLGNVILIDEGRAWQHLAAMMARSMGFIFSFLLLSLLIALSAFAADNLSSDTRQLLYDVNQKRVERLHGRFDPIIQNLDLGTASGSSKLYLDAVFDVFFGLDKNPQKAFQDWLKKNNSLVADPRLPLATQIAGLNLRGHLYLILEDEKDAVASFEAVLKELADGPPDLATFHLLQESLQDTLLVKYFKVDKDYLNLKDRYYGAIADVEPFFIQNILPWYQAHDRQRVEQAWDEMIAAAKQISLAREETRVKFDLTTHPQLLAKKADNLWLLGQKDAALKTLAEVLKDFPENPDFKKTEEKLIQWSTGK